MLGASLHLFVLLVYKPGGGSILKLRLRMGAAEALFTSPTPNIQGWEGQERVAMKEPRPLAAVSAWEIFVDQSCEGMDRGHPPSILLSFLQILPFLRSLQPLLVWSMHTEMQAFKQTNTRVHIQAGTHANIC